MSVKVNVLHEIFWSACIYDFRSASKIYFVHVIVIHVIWRICCAYLLYRWCGKCYIVLFSVRGKWLQTQFEHNKIARFLSRLDSLFAFFVYFVFGSWHKPRGYRDTSIEKPRRKRCRYDNWSQFFSIKQQNVGYKRIVFNWKKWVNIERNLIQFPHIRSLYGAYIINE